MKSRVDLASLAIAIAVTVAGCASLFAASSRVLRQYVAAAAAPVTMTREHIAFMATRAPAAPARAPAIQPSRAPGSSKGSPASTPPFPAAPAEPRDTGTSRVVSSGTTPQSLVPPRRPPQYVQSSLLPPKPRNPFMPAPVLTQGEMDSLLRQMGDSVPLLSRVRKMSAFERDSYMRVMATSKLVPGRAAQMPGFPPPGGPNAGGGISAPLFSAGPSASERRRDSAANVEYLARLRRLQDRVQARRESIRVADSMPRARNP